MSEGKDCLKSGVIRKIERIVCDCVNKVFSDRNPVCPSTLYEGKTNIMLTVRIARGAVFYVSHNRFGIPYNDIARHSHISDRNIIRSVKSYKDIPDSDNEVKRVNELIDVELSKFPIV